jgi:hypothetical protein
MWDTIRHLTEVKLREVSLVRVPHERGRARRPLVREIPLDAAKAGQLTDEQKAELLAFLQPAAATPAAPEKTAPAPDAPKGLAPDDPRGSPWARSCAASNSGASR